MFKTGEVVVLKSGGPRMIVKSIEDGVARCVWFDKNNEKKGEFPVELLASGKRRAISVKF